MTENPVQRLRDDPRLKVAGWDSYGGAALTEEALDAADAVAAGWHAVPTGDGGVQLEVHCGGWDIEIEIGADGQPCGALVGKASEDLSTYVEWPKPTGDATKTPHE
jgi:hypothetical protein